MTGQGLSVAYGSTNNGLRIRERVEWIVCHSDYVSSSETTTCNHQFSEYKWWGFFTKRIWMYRFGKFTNIWKCVCCQYCTYHQCSAALSCIATLSYCNYGIASLKYFRLNGKTILGLGNILSFFHIKKISLNTPKMFQVKEVVSLIVMGKKQWHNANLILIWNAKVLLSPKIPVLKSYKCVTSIPSSNLLVVQVSVLEVLKDVLPMHYHPICL